MIRGQDHLSVKDQMEDLRERMRLLQGDRKVYSIMLILCFTSCRTLRIFRETSNIYTVLAVLF